MGRLRQRTNGLRGQMNMKDVKAVFLFPNGNVAVCDAQGEQIPDLQGKRHLIAARLMDDCDLFGCTRADIERWSKLEERR